MTEPTVLVVDDDDDIRMLVQTALELSAGWRVITTNNGLDAIEMAQTHSPDVVLLDMMMPGMDGVTTFGHLQSDESTRGIPVILFTAKIQAGDRQAWDDYPIHGTIAKPFDPLTLADQVAGLLSWNAAR